MHAECWSTVFALLQKKHCQRAFFWRSVVLHLHGDIQGARGNSSWFIANHCVEYPM